MRKKILVIVQIVLFVALIAEGVVYAGTLGRGIANIENKKTLDIEAARPYCS